ncbi:Gfo/Idh/MocA family oxidoreductase [Microbacterium sp. STN6]|uniref:Gfo/Idh/MocA family protein n=1 Tax=Microbacterium sp. STN6 TaxID=2995588 RepID=UPI002260EEBD|nr:Gfo/Idh/MocA family oxidoreductase [Microbacterium sp. STN6]MCX7521802.1 Gfo/Idh/MocA family oxidoreductase [Microbacterium sp. STN6]
MSEAAGPTPAKGAGSARGTGLVRAAVIGCGDISSVHLAAIGAMPDAVLVAVCDTDPDRLSAAETALGVAGFADHRELLASVRPDVVHICTPHNTHVQIALDALAAGIDVILEKPLAHTRRDGQRLVEAASGSDARIAVCFQNRYNAPVQAAHELVRSGDLGTVLGASATVFWHRDAGYYEDRPWRGRWQTGGGGLLMNQAIHTIDLVQWLVGDVASTRGGIATRLLADAIDVEDTADLVMQHENGATSTLFATLSNAVNAPVTLDIVTEKATLALRGDLTVRYADGRVERVAERQLAPGARAYWGVSHELLIGDFYAGVGGGEPFWIDARAAQKSLEIIQDVYDQAYPKRPVGEPEFTFR